MAAKAPAEPAPAVSPASPLPEIENNKVFGHVWEFEYHMDLYNRMSHTCFKKCVDNNYRETELYLGENSCIDRCVSKYWQVRNIIGQMFVSAKDRV